MDPEIFRELPMSPDCKNFIFFSAVFSFPMPLRVRRHVLLHLFQVRTAMCAFGRLGAVNTLACTGRPVALAVSTETVSRPSLFCYRS